MAIKNRRGVYADFDPQKMVPGEFAVVQSGDPDTSSGKAVYICFIAGNVIRLATRTDIIQNIANEYSNASTYTKNQIVFYNGILYKSKNDISTPEEWTSANWERVYIADNLIVPGSGTNAELFNAINTNIASGTSSHAEGENTQASGDYSHSEGYNTEASGPYSHAEGQLTHATAQNYSSHAEGYMSTASGNASHAEGYRSTASGSYSHSENYITRAQGTYSHAEGYMSVASSNESHAEGYMSTASANASHAEGMSTTASKSSAHAEGNRTTASGSHSHAEGKDTIASGINAHAEGEGTQATSAFFASHAEGYMSVASGNYSHAEGRDTTASGGGSHTEGRGTIAKNACQHVFGQYNVQDPSLEDKDTRGTYVEIIGNGTADDARSNARTLDWEGNETLAGKLTVGASPVNDMDVATKAYADSIGSSITVSYTDPNNDGNIVISTGGL